MAISKNITLNNTILDGFDAAFNSGTLEFRTGPAPGAGNTATGTVLATIAIPADAFAAASGGTKAKNGTWTANGSAAGAAAHFRMVGGSNIVEGTVTATGGGGDIEVDNTSIAVAQPVTVTALNWTV